MYFLIRKREASSSSSERLIATEASTSEYAPMRQSRCHRGMFLSGTRSDKANCRECAIFAGFYVILSGRERERESCRGSCKTTRLPAATRGSLSSEEKSGLLAGFALYLSNVRQHLL